MTESIPSHRLACLFSEIGRLRSRFEDAEAERATEADHFHDYSARFIYDQFEDERAAKIVERQQSIDDLPDDLHRDAYVLLAARRLASEQKQEQDRSEPTSRLRNVFGSADADSKTYPLRPLRIERETLFPRAAGEHDETDTEGYEHLWNSLIEAIAGVDEYETLVHLLEKHTWCVPASPERPHLPLYDHLRTTAAIGDALYDSELSTTDLQDIADGENADEEDAEGEQIDRPCFSLIKGDLSGIQSFLHRMKSPDEAQDSLSKRMRGRSTLLWLLNESLATLFLGHLDLPCTSLIWSGGGQFYALVPTDSESGSYSRKLDEFEQKVNTWLFNRFNGDLFFVLGHADAQSDTSFATLFQHAAHSADERKLRKGKPIVSEIDTSVLGEATEPCPVCGDDSTYDGTRCKICEIQEKIGKDLPESNYLCLDHEEQDDDHCSHAERDDDHFSLELSDEQLSWEFVSEFEDADRLYTINSTERPEGADPWGFVFTGTTVPYGGAIDPVWPFTDQAKLARSEASLNHVVKMDIDDLGKTIGDSMESGVSRLAAISRMLSVFFGGYVDECAEKRSYASPTDPCDDCTDLIDEMDTRTIEHREFDEPESVEYHRPTDREHREHRGTDLLPETIHDDCIERVSPIYIGFSGGDDMFFVGPWDEAVEFGRDIRAELRAYCSGALTISAGFFLARENYPIGRSVEHAEERLERAKAYSENGTTKNAAWLFGARRGWELDASPDMTELIDLGHEFERLLEADELSQSVLHALFELGTDEDETDSDGTAVGVQNEWKTKYILSRNVDDGTMTELEDEISDALPWITVPVSWASLTTR